MELAYDKIEAEQEGLVTQRQTSDPANPSTLDKAADKLEAGIEQAFTKFSSTNWSGLWSAVKQQGEAAFKETRKEVEAALKKAGGTDEGNSNENSQNESTPTASSSNLSSSASTVTPDGGEKTDSDTQSDNSSAMLAALSQKAQIYIDELDRDLEKMENAAGSYLLRLGKDLKTLLKDAVAVNGPTDGSGSRSRSGSDSGEDAPAELLFNVPEVLRNQIYSTRLDAQLHALHTSKEPFMTTTDEPDYQKFEQDFDVDGHTDEIASDLEKHPKLRQLMESLIPDPVSYETFWTKYYYMRKQIAEQETRRKQLLQQAAAGAEQDVNWDDDEDEEAESKEANKSTDTSRAPDSSRPSSESSYDLISKNESGLNLANKNIPPTKEEDSDDDWE
jgi:hypothetical protein